MRWLFNLLRRKGPQGLILARGQAGPRLLILSGEKRNQNYYRDVALLRRAGGALLTDAFDFRATGWDVDRVAETVLDGQKPDLVFVSYHHGFTSRFQGLDRPRAPKVGFVGDSYDFLGEDAKRAEKAAWFRAANFDALLSVYPHTDEMVWAGLGRRVPIFHSAWAVDADVFAPQGRRRRYDIASLGAHTAGKYPFRIAVRDYLESQHELRFYSRQRMPGGHDGPRFAGETVIWGGLIIETLNRQGGTILTVLETPLDSLGMPGNEETTRGRVKAVTASFLDNEVYKKGRRVTLAGEVLGKEVQALGQTQYAYPLLSVRELHLWTESYRPYGYYYGPYSWGPYWWYWDWWWPYRRYRHW